MNLQDRQIYTRTIYRMAERIHCRPAPDVARNVFYANREAERQDIWQNHPAPRSFELGLTREDIQIRRRVYLRMVTQAGPLDPLPMREADTISFEMSDNDQDDACCMDNLTGTATQRAC